MKHSIFLFLSLTFLILSCSSDKKGQTKSGITESVFGKMPDGTEVMSYTVVNNKGMEMKAISYGGIITSLKVPDRKGNLEDVVLGYDNLQGYLDNNPYFGAIIGRYGNRIAKGKFTLDEQEYTLAANNLGNHLHGGIKGFDKVLWNVWQVNKDDGLGLVFNYKSADMEEGYPGNLDVTVTYFLTHNNSLEFYYQAKTDKKTIINLTQHTYFNLTAMKDNILKHQLEINASGFLPVDSTLIPTGEIRPVSGTPFDFTTAKEIGRDIGMENKQLAYGNGYDHNWVLNEGDGEMNYAGSLYEPKSGRFVEVYTEEPGLQFYSGNFLDGSITGKGNVVYQFRSGLCLETQHYPDSPNQPDFPSVVLNPDQEYKTKTVYKFSVK